MGIAHSTFMETDGFIAGFLRLILLETDIVTDGLIVGKF
jgi:hypothetical protein